MMLASSWLDLDNELNRNDETCNNEDFEDCDFPAFRPNYDRRAHAHHSINMFCPEHMNAFTLFSLPLIVECCLKICFFSITFLLFHYKN